VLLRDACERLGAAAAQVPPDIDVTTELLEDYPTPRLVAESRHARLVVVGDRGLGGLAGLPVGSVAITLAAHADCPVVVVRGEEPGGAPRSEGPVVVGIDASPTSEAALAFAFEKAAARRAPLVALHSTWLELVVPPMSAFLVDWVAIETKEYEVLAERLAGWGEKFPDVPVERVVTWDRPARTLVERSDGAQLVVVGSCGRGSFAGLVLGSVSHALLHRANCPVAVIRPVGPADS
jgi:nucleotide-binding universal stress UspA family protein